MDRVQAYGLDVSDDSGSNPALCFTLFFSLLFFSRNFLSISAGSIVLEKVVQLLDQ